MVPSDGTTRAILHVDMDAFFASVEIVRRPELRGRPVAVGGTGDRGVIAAASYEARLHGVRSAMPSARARRLCPDLVLLPGDLSHYAEVSARIMAIFESVTPLVEPLSFDEAFLDVTGSRRLRGTAEEIATELRHRVREDERLTCSVGVAPNKFLAKLASADAKPVPAPGGPRPGPGVLVVAPGEELAYLHPLAVSRLWGVGPSTLAKLQRLGARTVGDLATLPVEAVTGLLGTAAGRHLHSLANGIDDRPVEPDRSARSISSEETFTIDRRTVGDLRTDLVRLADTVAARLRRDGLRARTVHLKVRYADFHTVTRSRTLATPTDRPTTLREEAWTMLCGLPVERGVRLLGVGSSKLTRDETVEQLSLRGVLGDDDEQGRRDPADADAAVGVVDEIRRRFGSSAIGPASLASGEPPRRSLWGPDRPGSDR